MDNLTSAKEWQRFAEMDLMSAEHLLKMRPIPIEIICYHCQQSAEKYLKGYPMQLILEEKDMQEAIINAKAIRDFIINIAPQMAQEE